jgi:hypothetical protein
MSNFGRFMSKLLHSLIHIIVVELSLV